jgi:hypothetical protein
MAEDDLMPAAIRIAAPKPRMTVYYALLILALLAMLTACGFLYAEIRRFGGFGVVPQRIAATTIDGDFLTTKAQRHKDLTQKLFVS